MRRVKRGSIVDMLAAELRKARLQAGLTQKQLAAKVGTCFVTISSYERRKQLPAPDTLDKLLQALDATLECKITLNQRPQSGDVV